MAAVHVLLQVGVDQQRQGGGIKTAIAHQKVEQAAGAPQRHLARLEGIEFPRRLGQRHQIVGAGALIAGHQRHGFGGLGRIGGNVGDRRAGFLRHEQQVHGIGRIVLLDDGEAGGFDHARERAGREMKQVLVDEPFLDNVLAADQGDIGGVDHQQPAGPQYARMIFQRRKGFGQMFDGVAGMNDVEAAVFERRVLGAQPDQFGARQAGAGIGMAFVRLQRGQRGIGRLVEKGADKAAAVGADIQQLQRRRQVGMAGDGVHCLDCAEALAVAHIAPVGAARHGGGMALRRPRDARRALHQPAAAADIDLQPAGGAIGRMGELQGGGAAEIAMKGHGPAHKYSGNHVGREMVNNSRHIRRGRHSPAAPASARRWR